LPVVETLFYLGLPSLVHPQIPPLTAVMSGAVIEDTINFEFIMIVDRDGVRRRRGLRAMVNSIRRCVRTEEGYMKDRVYFEGAWEFKFVHDRGDLLDDAIWANEPVLWFL
jgi:hypothetical protein